MRRWRNWLLALGAWGCVAAAEPVAQPSLYGHVGVIGVWAEHNGWRAPDNVGQWSAQHEAALGLNWRLDGQTRLTARVVSEGRGRMDDGSPRVDILALNRILSGGHDHTFGVQVGRIRNTLFGLYSVQDIPSQRPGVVPPIVYLSSVVPEVFSSMDGAQLYGSRWIEGVGELEWQLYGGLRLDVDNVSQEYYMFGADAPGGFDRVSQLGGKLLFSPARLPGAVFGVSLAQVSQRWASGQTVAQAQARYGADLAAGSVSPYVAPYLVDFRHDSVVGVLSASHDWGRWRLTGEVSAADFVLHLNVAGQLRRTHATVYLGYAQLMWRPLARLRLWARVGATGFSKDLGVVHPSNPYRNYAQHYTLAGRWHFTPTVFLTAQASEISGTAAWPIYPGSYETPMARNSRVYLVELTWQF